MNNMNQMWNNVPLPPNSFCELRELNVSDCRNLLVLVSTYMQNRLQNLTTVAVRNCLKLEEFFEGHAVISESGETPSISQLGMQTRGLQNLTTLHIDECRNLKYLFSPSVARCLVKLRKLKIIQCVKMEEVIRKPADGEETENNSMLPQLTHLDLSYLNNLTSFSQGHRPSESTQVGVGTAHLFDEKVDFPVLKTLKLCRMNNIVQMWNNVQLPPNSFCELRELDVFDCSNLLDLVSTHAQNRLQNLTTVAVRRCYKLREIFEGRAVTISESGEAPSISQLGMQTGGLQNLTTLVIRECHSLKYLFSPSVARCLVKLGKLEIKDCMKLEEVIRKPVDGEETDNNSMLPQLTHLDLQYLEDLTSFSQGSYTFEWPLVANIKIYGCYKMRNFCSGPLSIARDVDVEIHHSMDPNVLQELNNSRK